VGLTQFGDIILKIEVWADVHSVAQKAALHIAEEARASGAGFGARRPRGNTHYLSWPAD